MEIASTTLFGNRFEMNQIYRIIYTLLCILNLYQKKSNLKSLCKQLMKDYSQNKTYLLKIFS
ncbi:hypothetical protein BpHYR1_022155 [Brachionus plicatilis]|uniref:Uncharacterized protein n=1 Tax=Brachionus plicatilis TaxID=10195 RepID=A0A3M7SKJ2_BRAPC|nr:hypothetical protein BpHYR1_022155 [Brachionus plicatilis]